MRARVLAVLGTGSDVGKTLINAGICRLLHRAGVHVAPFKAQNMSLNSFVTPDGREIGRAQALQAEACGIPPHVDMNPILLKPESDSCSQVVVLGQVFGKYKVADYCTAQWELRSVVAESYARLASQHEMIVIEGAGSAAEVNLKQWDLVNWPVVEMADAHVVLVADIDRGGVFAQVLGTLDLLDPDQRARVRGIIVNKFRGDATLFADGVQFLTSRSGIPVWGVVPFLRDLMLDQEDSLNPVRNRETTFSSDRINIGVILLPCLSNFTDFNVLAAEDDVALQYARDPAALLEADIIILPGSKSTVTDLHYVQESGFAPVLDKHLQCGGEIIGICGGYQMLGRTIVDPGGVEQGGTTSGLGFLNTETILTHTKHTLQVEACPTAEFMPEPSLVRGYEIHMGVTRRVQERPCFSIRRRCAPDTTECFDGASRKDGLVWGTYIHGVFDEPGFRRAWLNRARVRKGLSPLDIHTSKSVSSRLRGELDRWADHLSRNVDLSCLLR